MCWAARQPKLGPTAPTVTPSSCSLNVPPCSVSFTWAKPHVLLSVVRLLLPPAEMVFGWEISSGYAEGRGMGEGAAKLNWLPAEWAALLWSMGSCPPPLKSYYRPHVY